MLFSCCHVADHCTPIFLAIPSNVIVSDRFTCENDRKNMVFEMVKLIGQLILLELKTKFSWHMKRRQPSARLEYGGRTALANLRLGFGSREAHFGQSLKHRI